MATLARLGHLILSVYGKPREHAPPHFHVSGPDVDFTVKFENLQILAGRADRKSLRIVVEWAEAHRDQLQAAWSELNERD